MRCGLFGKLPAKRDFIALYTPRAFLNAWEAWMQAGMSASREMLAGSWKDAFLTAPIWRFWLGADVCGSTVLGAFMPSLDGLGRYYPLTLFACADDGTAIPPPDIDSHDDWFAAGEELLLSALGQHAAFETLSSGLDSLKPPAVAVTRSSGEGTRAPIDGIAAGEANGRCFPDLFASLRAANAAAVSSAATFWWTIGGREFPSQALCCRRMPDPFLFASMLTGGFESASTGQ
jgi:type VI secretion system protein ImpM